MQLTVEEALRIYPLSRARVAAGEKGMARVITSVNMMDAPDVVDWVKKGEMLFTTAFAIKDTPEDFLRLIQKLNDRGAAGLAIKLGRYWTKIPPVVIQEANRMNLPLIELPYEFTFADQMNALVQAEIEKSTRKLHDALDKQKSLMRFAMQPGDSVHHLQRIGEILSHPIVVVGARGQVLYSTCSWPEAEILKDWPWSPKFDKARSISGWRCSVPLLQDGECSGFLLIMPQHAAAIAEEEGLFHQAAEILSYHMDRFQDERQSVAGYRWTLILERYLQHKITPEQFLEQTQAVGKKTPDSIYLCVKTSLDSSEEQPPKRLRKIRRELIYHPYLVDINSQHLFLDDGLVSLFTLPEGGISVSAFMQRIVSSFQEVLEDTAGEPDVRCYVSKPKMMLADILEASSECDHARSMSKQLSFGRSVTLFSDLELNYLFQYIPQETLKRYSSHMLLPLLQKDREYSTEMLITLEAYFANEGNVNGASKQLFIHRNTVLYRLEKISELLGVDMRKISDLLQLKLALLFRQLSGADHDRPGT